MITGTVHQLYPDHARRVVVNVRDIYGTRKAYPACPNARLFAELAGTKTLTREALRIVADLGYRIEVLGGTLTDIQA